MLILRNIIAVVIGFIIGSIVNIQIIDIGMSAIPLVEGIDPMDALEWDMKHFITPFFAHALGTLSGAFVAAVVASTNKKIFALVIGTLFLAGGIAMVFIITAPVWFIVLDLIVAYIPMGWIGWRLASSIKFN
ncbi:MAG: hypothetical protein COA49_06550 [Bacteroidetes bacterium]|nr:MAG: hypothetical protein COA49_06550 [Bacteroidota bacterium]